MKKIQFCFSLNAFLLFAFFANAQTINNKLILDSLNSALFPKSKGSIEITSFFGHEKQKMDSIYQVRKVQPDIDHILPILKEMAYSKDTGLLQPLINLYNKQQSFFKKEWEPVHRNNFYACDAANKQFSILEAFEKTIHSLIFGNMGLDRNAKLSYYKKYVQSQYSYYHAQGDWPEAIKGWHIYSPYYMMLQINRWVGPPLNEFSFIEPYINEIDDLLIEELNIYFKNLDSIKTGVNLSFEQFELDYLCGVISLSKTTTYNEKLLYLILADKRNKPGYIYARLFPLLNNQNYKKHIKSFLLKNSVAANKVVMLNSLYGLIAFHDMDVIVHYEKLLSNKNLGILEKQAIKAHLSILDRQLNASNEVRQSGARLLKQMNN